jgi:hypothetical protein
MFVFDSFSKQRGWVAICRQYKQGDFHWLCVWWFHAVVICCAAGAPVTADWSTWLLRFQVRTLKRAQFINLLFFSLQLLE